MNLLFMKKIFIFEHTFECTKSKRYDGRRI